MKSNKNNLRIISGNFKGKKIITSNNKNIRPTTSLIRKIIFEWLNKYIYKSKCLDCFAGTGILSIEAISRKASHVTILEKSYKNIKNIKKNIKFIPKNKYSLINIDTIKWLKKKQNKKYNILFIDPPYKKNYINIIIKLIQKTKIIKKKFFIYIESLKKENIIIPNNWIIYKIKYTQISKHIIYTNK